MALTEEQVKKYVEGGGVKCPSCENEDIVGDDVLLDEGGAYQEMSCNACDFEWTDLYNLIGIFTKPKD